MFYFISTPWWLKKLYKQCVWNLPDEDKIIYLSFDDGPHPTITPFVLDELNKYNAKATFFCIGKNVFNNSDVYRRIITDGHAVGNHTFNHLNGWKTTTENYVQNIQQAEEYIDSNLFRPPYGKITRQQIRVIKTTTKLNVVMWSVLSADFDVKVSMDKCFKNVVNNVKPGSIVVFHDSEKAFNNLQYALPRVLKHFSEKGFVFRKIII